MAYSWRLLNSLGCLPDVFRDTFFATGRAQAANNADLRFGTGLILGFAVGCLWLRFRSKRVSLAQTALRLYPRRRAICAALRPTAQSFLSSATSSASQLMGDVYTPIADNRLVDSRAGEPKAPGNAGRTTGNKLFCSCLGRDQLFTFRGPDRQLHLFAAAAGRNRRENAISVFRIGFHAVVEQYRVAAFQRYAQWRGRFDTEELKIHARALGREIDQNVLVRMRHVAHADGRAVGLRNRHFAQCGKAGAVEKLVRHARPQFDVRSRFVRLLAWVGFVRKRRKSPRPHFQARRDRIVGDADA